MAASQQNPLGLSDATELAPAELARAELSRAELSRAEERLSKARAVQLFDEGLLTALNSLTSFTAAPDVRELFMRGIDASYAYEGYAAYSASDVAEQ